jgi:pSer/pThr/pTyr-binding forkhead associated (FHA) protein
MRLLLKNTTDNPHCHISVKEFPFLIGRKEPALVAIEGFEQKVTDAVSYLSRKHASITLENEHFYIADHGSLNGTSVNNRTVGDEKVEILHGDIIGFSGKLHFTIIDESPPKETPPPQEKTIIIEEPAIDQDELAEIYKINDINKPVEIEQNTPQDTENKTVYMTSATTFLDILAKDGSVKKATEEANQTQKIILNKQSEKKLIYTQFTKKFSLIVIPVLALIAVAFFLYNSSSSVQLDKLYKNTQYTQSVVLADKILSNDSKDEQAQIILFNSIIRSTLAAFPEALEQGRFEEMEQLLNQARQSAAHSNKLSQVINLLQLASELQRHFQNKNAETLSFNLSDKDAYDAMQQQWKENKLDYTSYLDELGGHLASFSEVRRITYNNLNLLQQSRSGKLQAADALLEKIQSHLNNDIPGLISEELFEFKKKYPFISGISVYENDLSLYLKIWKAITTRDINTLITIIPKTNFQTLLFQDKLALLKQSTLPPDQLLLSYLNAEEAWFKGDHALATSFLQPLTTETWGEVAAERLLHYNTVYKEYLALADKKQQADYTDDLISFLKLLQPNDIFFRKIFQDDLVKIQNKQIESAAVFLKKAKGAWNKYLEKGRIKGILRLQNEVSADYKTRALLLTDAYTQTIEAEKIYKTYALDIPPEDKIIHTQIISEASNQVARMQNLEGALDTEIFRAKINLLPKIMTE